MPNLNLFNENIAVNLSVRQVAELFCNLDDTEQAEFFNCVAEIATSWSQGGLVMQLQYVTDNTLTLGGRRVMQMIGEYSHWGLVPKAEMPKAEIDWDTKIHPVHDYD